MDWSELFYYDPSSPSFLRNQTTRSNRQKLGQVSGGLSGPQKDKRYLIQANGIRVYNYRVIWELFNGPIPEGFVVDHIDRDPLNCQIDNLRLCRQQENVLNKETRRRDLPRGVYQNKSGTYYAQITYKGKTYNLGTRTTAEEQEQLYLNKQVELFGEYNPL